MPTRITAYNARGGKVSTWTVARPGDVFGELIDNARRVRAIGGYAVDGVGMFTVDRTHPPDVTLRGIVDGLIAKLHA
jgi:hypothetical protein